MYQRFKSGPALPGGPPMSSPPIWAGDQGSRPQDVLGSRPQGQSPGPRPIGPGGVMGRPGLDPGMSVGPEGSGGQGGTVPQIGPPMPPPQQEPVEPTYSPQMQAWMRNRTRQNQMAPPQAPPQMSWPMGTPPQQQGPQMHFQPLPQGEYGSRPGGGGPVPIVPGGQQWPPQMQQQPARLSNRPMPQEGPNSWGQLAAGGLQQYLEQIRNRGEWGNQPGGGRNPGVYGGTTAPMSPGPRPQNPGGLYPRPEVVVDQGSGGGTRRPKSTYSPAPRR